MICSHGFLLTIAICILCIGKNIYIYICPYYPYNTGLKSESFFSNGGIKEQCLQIWMCQLSLCLGARLCCRRRCRNAPVALRTRKWSFSSSSWCSAITPTYRVVGILLLNILDDLYWYVIYTAHELCYPWDTSAKGNWGTASLGDLSQVVWGFWESWKLVWSLSVVPWPLSLTPTAFWDKVVQHCMTPN